MHIVVASALDPSVPMANAINTTAMAGGFADLGHRVTLICLRPAAGSMPEARIREDFLLPASVQIIQVPQRLFGIRLGPHWPFSVMSLAILFVIRPDIVFLRSYILPVLTTAFRIPTIVEIHADPDNKTPEFLRFLGSVRHRMFKTLSTFSAHSAKRYMDIGIPAEKIVFAPSPVRLGIFSPPAVPGRSPFPDPGRANVVYSGNFYASKGIDTIIEAAARLPHVNFTLIGGRSPDFETYEKSIVERGLTNLTLLRQRPLTEVPPYLWHADALLVTATGSHETSQWTAPVKLGEYMCTGVPIVASAVPALVELLDQEVEFVSVDDPDALAAGIENVLNNNDHAERLATAARSRVKEFAHTARAERLLKHALGDRSG